MLARALFSVIAFERAFRAAAAFVTTVIVAHHLGAAQFGDLVLIMGTVSICAGFAPLGLDGVLLRDVLARPCLLRPAIRSSIAARAAAFSAAAIPILGIAHHLIPNVPFSSTVIFCVCLPFSALETLTTALQARDGLAIGARYRIASTIVSAGARLAAVFSYADFFWIAASFAIEPLLVGSALALAVRTSGGLGAGPSGDRAWLRGALAETWSLAISGQIIVIYMRFTLLAVGTLLGNSAAGVFSLAQRISESWTVLVSAVIQNRSASVMRSATTDHDHANMRRFFADVYRLALLLGITTALVGFFAVHFLLGPSYGGTSALLLPLGFSSVFIALGIARSIHMSSARLNRHHVTTTVMGCAVSIGSFFALTPPLGLFGAACSVAIGYTTAVWLSCYAIPELRPTGRLLASVLAFRPRSPETHAPQ